MIELARQYGSYGYGRVAALLRDAGWQVSDGRVERLWKLEGLKVPAKQPRKGAAFLEIRGCSPYRYIKRRRMTKVYEDLVAANGSSRSVKAAALAKGFVNSGRFAAEYQALFGKLPPATLACAGSNPR